MLKYALLAAVFLTVPAAAADDQPIDGKKEMSPSVAAAGPEVPHASLCEGNGCDAYLPAALFTPRYRDEEGARRRNAVIGAASGAIVGNEIGGLPAAIGLASLGAAMGYHQSRAEMEARARAYDAAWIRGDDIYYNPVYAIPVNPHYWGGKRK
ncbi:hypothetical protein [Kordiimonas marina]|uniref:hypothetical protein n=1 Tax=Kordiimonas marina TaxID=2872312 RepID=UPI001FF3FBD5|nr:hypothetical protein [Kordiimonas marina]MCJ9429206.1 hypothetical protein [Kordiimonas marina]